MAELVSLGWEQISWIEHYLVHGPGDVEGQPVVLDDERAGVLLRMYALQPRRQCVVCRKVTPVRALEETPWRCAACKELLQVRRAVDEYQLSRAKGWAKSELAGMVASVEALGPARFDGWDADGEPVGRPVRYPFVRCLATEETQSGNTYGNIAFMLHPETASPELTADYGGIDAGRDWQTSTRIYLPEGGEIRPSTASSAAKDGGKESFAVEDEPHLWFIPELIAMHHTVHRNVFKRRDAEGWLLQTTTMYRPGQGSVAETTAAAAATGDAPGVVIDHRQASKGLADLKKPTVRQVVKLLEESFGDAAGFHDLERTAQAIVSGRYDQPDRYAFNRPTTHDDDWCDVAAWDAKSRMPADADPRTTRKPRPPKGTRITLGFDGSEGTADARIPDSTVLRATVLQDGPWSGFTFTIGIWEADGDADWEPPWEAVDQAVDDAFAHYDVWRAYCDPKGWRDWIKGWQGRHGPDRVIEWQTYRDRQMAAALDILHKAIHHPDAEFSHDGDPRARAHYANVRRNVKLAAASSDPDEKKELVLVRKETPRSVRKIDCVVGDALALEARADGIAAGAHIVKRRARAYGF